MPASMNRRKTLKHHLSAVYLYGLPSEETCTGTSEEAHHAGDLFRLAVASERNAFGFGTRRAASGARGVHRSRRDAVGADAAVAELARERPRHADQSVFGHRPVHAVLRTGQ